MNFLLKITFIHPLKKYYDKLVLFKKNLDGKSSFKFKIIIFKNTQSMAIPTWAYSNLHAKFFFPYLGCVCFSVKYFPGVKYF